MSSDLSPPRPPDDAPELSALVRQLTGRFADEAQVAAQELIEAGDLDALPPLLSLLGDRSAPRRGRLLAEEVLSALDPDQANTISRRLIDDDTEDLRLRMDLAVEPDAAAETLADIAARDTGRLRQLARSGLESLHAHERSIEP